MNDDIRIIDAYENNLKHINVTIPKSKLVVFAGISGSGKSSLAFETIAAESSREWQSSYPLFLRNKMPHYDRPKVGEIQNLTPSIVVDQKPLGNSTRSTVGTAIDAAPLIRLLFSRVGKPSAGGSMAYSFNHPLGMCPDCTGLGERLELIEDRMFNTDLTLNEGALRFSQFSSGWQTHLYQNNPLLDPNKKLRDFTDEEWDILKYGSKEPVKIGIRSNNTGRVDMVEYEGVIPRFERLYLKRDIGKLKKGLQDEIYSLVDKCSCKSCGGTGLNPAALQSKINGYNIVDFNSMTAAELQPILQEITDPVGRSIARQLSAYLERMIAVGIGYLAFSRRTETLSGGEAQRIKMVRNLGSSLNNITYIFDEPTAGLHPADAEKIGRLLVDLRDKGNNVLVVEHSRQMIELADHIIEMGEGAGTNGGRITFEGTVNALKEANTPTAAFLKEAVVINPNPKEWTESFAIRDTHCHNLKHIDVDIPKGVLTAVTGVAGSGKSSLACHEFVRAYPDAIVIDQKPIGTSIRSTPATYTGVMDEIRKLFAKENKLSASWFSFNSKGGCPVCKGTGKITYDMAFAEPVTVKCEECGGRRYNEKALSCTYKGKNIEEVMALTIAQALDFFEDDKIRKPLKTLCDIGLGYLTLGQPTGTLSGGEIQRIKLASELHKEGKTFVLDEPSTGLHHQDVGLLLKLFRRLVSQNNTVIIVEHRPELIAQCDWIIDMGPEGGANGGRVIAQGTPAEIADNPDSITGRYIKNK